MHTSTPQSALSCCWGYCGLPYFAIYVFFPRTILLRSVGTGRQGELLYFSLINLSTIGYGYMCRLPVRSECWWHWNGSLVFFTSRFLWQCWSVPISKNESNNETPKAAVPVYILRWLRSMA
jgi:hypothetical protein